jgi:integrase
VRIERELAKSRRSKDAQTARARQAHFLEFVNNYTLDADPCGNVEVNGIDLVNVYIKSVILGENCRNKDQVRASTVKGYAKQINALFEMRNLRAPITIGSKACPNYVLIYNAEKEEDIAKRRKPITAEMAARIIKKGKNAPFLSKEALMSDVTVLNREAGCRAAELLQTTPFKVDQHEYPSGKKVNKAMGRSWFRAYDKYDREIKDPVRDRRRVAYIIITWKIQKNRRNGEETYFYKNEKCGDLCVINAILNMLQRAQMLGQSDLDPMCVYKDSKGRTRYLTRQETTNYIRSIAKEVNPHITKADLAFFSCHSFRVWAAILLHEAGKNGDYIKIRLRWVSEAYRVYLRNTKQTARLHSVAITSNEEEIKFSLTNLPDTLTDDQHWITDDEEDDMQDYDDDDTIED